MNAAFKIDKARWAELDIFNQMGNIYSEVGRSFKAKGIAMGQTDTEESLAVIGRAIDLFDASVQVLIAKKSPQAREVLRAKEQFLDVVLDNNATKESVQSLDKYFMQFAIAARLNR